MKLGKDHIKRLSDVELISQFRATGAEQYFRVLFDRYLFLVYGVCLKYLKSRTASQDATMEVLHKVSDRLRQEEVTHFKSWLYVLCKNHCLMQLRRKEILHYTDTGVMEISEEMHPTEDRELKLTYSEECLKTLSDHQKKCINLFYLESCSYKEIAVTCKLSLLEVKSAIQNGKRNLRKCIEKRMQHIEK